MCKAYKTNGESRWTGKDLDGIRRFERERSEWLGDYRKHDSDVE